MRIRRLQLRSLRDPVVAEPKAELTLHPVARTVSGGLLLALGGFAAAGGVVAASAMKTDGQRFALLAGTLVGSSILVGSTFDEPVMGTLWGIVGAGLVMGTAIQIFEHS